MTVTTKKPRGRPAAEGLKERRQDEILDVAARIFAAKGYPSTDVQEVADALGVGKGTIYRYFPTKQELFEAAVDRGMRRLDQLCEDVRNSDVDPLERIAQAIRQYLTFFNEQPEFAELLIQERAEFKERRKSTYFVHQEMNRGRWQAFCRELIDTGRFRQVPVERIMDVVGDLVYGTMFANRLGGRRKAPEAQAQEIVDILFHGILSDKERARRSMRR